MNGFATGQQSYFLRKGTRIMPKKVSLTFDSAWVLSKKDEEPLLVNAFLAFVRKVMDVEVLEFSLTDCAFVVKSEDATEEGIKNEIETILKQVFSAPDPDKVVDCDILDYTMTEAPKQETAESSEQPESNDQTAPSKPSKPANQTKDIIEQINALVGAKEFKDLANECVAVAPGLIANNAVDAFTHQCYIFSINDGYGLTTYLHSFASLLRSLNLIKIDERRPVLEVKIPSSRDKDSGRDPFVSFMTDFHRYGYKDQIISIDISEWMSQLSDKRFRNFLFDLEDCMGENIIVFRVPFVEKDILDQLKKRLGDVLFVRDVSFVPFSLFELSLYAEKAIKERGFTVEDEAWDVFNTRLAEEKNDGRFYGINTVNKVILEMIYLKQLYNARNDGNDTVIKRSEIMPLAASYNEHQKTGMEMMDELIGMDTVKTRVEEIVAQIELAAKNSRLSSPCIHMRFVGNPGTGKTTVARVIGQILKEKGILRNGHFFEYSGRDFCGQYVGETAPKTSAMCRDAYGSVLFIDEAYSLYRGPNHSSADYGQEAIDTLIAEMENHRSDLMVIMAGYTDDMDRLMQANAGLESRMPYIIEFPNYTREQLFEIFMSMVNKNFTYRDGFEEAVKEFFGSLSDEVISAKEFSNARFVRNLFERTWGKAILRAQMNKEDPAVLIKEDFLLASSEKEFKKIMKKQHRTLGFA